MTWISIHILKHIVTIGFVCGLISLAVKYLDERLPNERKEAFGEWVLRAKLRARSWSIRGLFGIGQTNPPKYACLYAISGAVIGLAADRYFHLGILVRPDQPGEELTTLNYIFGVITTILCAWPASFVLIFVFSRPTFESARKTVIETALIISGVVILMVIVSAVMEFRSGDAESFGQHLYDIYEGMGGIPQGLLFITVLSFLPFVLLSSCVVPITLITRVIDWLTKYPKGAWAGLVFALTIVLGIFRLFM